MIGSTAFGLRANSLQSTKSEFYINNLLVFELTARRAFDFLIFFMFPSLVPVLRVKFFSAPASKFLRRSIKYAIEERERSGTCRNDLIDNLILMKREAKADPKSPANEFDFLVAQAAIFNLGGFETSSSTMSFCLYELAMNTQIQERLRSEICGFFEEGKDHIAYDRIVEMHYLEQVVNETLRKYTIIGHLERQCTPLKGTKGYSLLPFVDFEVPAGMPIYISQMGISRDEQVVFLELPLQFKHEELLFSVIYSTGRNQKNSILIDFQRKINAILI